MSLNEKQKTFVAEYLVDLNGAQAAVRAGYSVKTAREQASRLLADANIAAAIATAQAERARRTDVTQDRVVIELARLAFSDLGEVMEWGVKEIGVGYDEDGTQLRPDQIGEAVLVRYVEAPFATPRNSADLPPEVRAAIAEVSLTKDGLKIKLHSKTAALEKLGLHLGMFKAATGDGGLTLEEMIMAAVRRRRQDDEPRKIEGQARVIDAQPVDAQPVEDDGGL